MKILIGLCLMLLTGCVHVWCNPSPNASQEQFSQVKYACMSGNAHPYTNVSVGSAAAAGPYGSAASSGVSVNSGIGVNPYMFRACMEASGYQLMTPKQCEEQLPSRPMAYNNSPCVISKTAICTDMAPPKAKQELVAKPLEVPADWIWEPGFYQWYPKTGYQWTDGHWAEPREGHHWIAPHWLPLEDEHKWIFVAGYWVKA